MRANKTKPEDVPPGDFLQAISHDKRRRDAQALANLMAEVTGERAVMWGPSIVGYGTYHFHYDSGRQGDTPVVGFAPRRQALAVYGLTVDGYSGALADLLGPHTTSKSCLYIKDLAAVDLDVLAQMIDRAYKTFS